MRRVLIVDDEPLVADTLRLIFQKNGFESRCAYSVDEGIACAAMFKPELLLCDIGMPVKDGTEMISAMNLADPNCKILVLTGAYSSIPRVRAHAQELHRQMPILAKPCSPVELLREADELLLIA